MEVTQVSKFMRNPSILRGVSKLWKKQIEEKDKGIFQRVHKKYPESKSIYEIIRSAVQSDDRDTIFDLTEYSGYLPFDWDHIVPLVIRENNPYIAKIISSKTENKDLHSLSSVVDKSYSQMNYLDLLRMKEYKRIKSKYYNSIIRFASHNILNISLESHQWIKNNILDIKDTTYKALLYDDPTILQDIDPRRREYIIESILYLDDVNIWLHLKEHIHRMAYPYMRGKILSYVINSSDLYNIVSDLILYTECIRQEKNRPII